jgi:tRNA-splicing ligase RtcB
VIETFANGKVRSWASVLDDVTREQAVRTAELPILSAPVALMPDAHLGAGATIGTVLVTERAVIPMAVGVDIGCGMAARKLALALDDLDDLATGRWVSACTLTVPAGLGKWHATPSEDASDWLERHPLPDALTDARRVADQLGTLGSGNHFVELSVDEEGGVWLLLHSGSRGAGNKLAQLHARAAIALNGARAPDRDLAWLDAGTPEFDAYVRDLEWAQAYAMENRRELLVRTHAALESVVERPIAVEDEVNCHHNYAAFEEVAELGRPMYVTRKGAISAHRGDRGLIPGAMGQASFVVSGLGNPASYESCAHGAGRAMSRHRARREISTDDFVARMAGVAWQDADAVALLDEAPQSYKDVETVMRDQADLVSIDHRLKAIANYKGVESARRRR